MLWKFGMCASLTLFAAAEIPAASDIGPFANISAVAVLAGVCWKLFSALDKLCDRWDAWEKVRHDDSKTLNETLSKLQSHCASQQAGCET